MSRDNSQWKMEGEELQQYLHFRKRGGGAKPIKGKGSEYSRKEKHKKDYEQEKNENSSPFLTSLKNFSIIYIENEREEKHGILNKLLLEMESKRSF